MGYTDPYATLLNGVVSRLVDTGNPTTGPFTKADQVKLWIDEALNELAPSTALVQELSREVPVALVCDGGSDRDGDEDSDGLNENKTVKVYFCSGAPTIAAAVGGDGTAYWGMNAIQHWVLSRLVARDWNAANLSGWEALRWQSTKPVAVAEVNRAIMVATFTSLRRQDA